MTSIHEPTPEFERYLEWQVTAAVRRQNRFAHPSASGFRTRVRAMAVVVASISLGAGVVMASGRLQQDQQSQVLTVQQQGELQLAETQLTLAQKNLDDTKRLTELHLVPSDDMATAQRNVQTATITIQRIRLNIEEVRMSGHPVQDDVTAPLVNGRDFVLERLELDKSIAAAAATEAEKRLQAMQSRYDVGLVSQMAVSDARTALVRCTSDMKTIDEKIALRRRFISGGLSPTDATRQRLLIAAQNELRSAEAALELATQRFAEIDRLKQAAAAGELDALKAQIEVLSRRQDVQRLRERLTALQKGGPLPQSGR